jgi:hypothetical protein
VFLVLYGVDAFWGIFVCCLYVRMLHSLEFYVAGGRKQRRMKFFGAKTTYRLTSPLGWLLVYLLLVQGAMPTLVLCFGSSGHIAVEIPHSPISHPTSQSQGPCLDVLLLMEKPEAQTLVMAPATAVQSVAPILTYAAAALWWLTASLPSDTSRHLGFTPILPLALLSPVILRI